MNSSEKWLPSVQTSNRGRRVDHICTPLLKLEIKSSHHSRCLVENASTLSLFSIFRLTIITTGFTSYCRVGFTCRCVESQLFGTPNTPGGQAQYVRVPRAGGTLYNLEGISAVSVRSDQETKGTIGKLADSSLLLLSDILPTGVFAAFQALNHPKTLPMLTSRSYPQSSGAALLGSGVSVPLEAEDKVLTVAIVGLGPVGVVRRRSLALPDTVVNCEWEKCASIALLDMLYARDVEFRIVAIDPTEVRRKKMEAIYAKVSQAYGKQQNGHLEVSDIATSGEVVTRWTKGIGCNSVLEVSMMSSGTWISL